MDDERIADLGHELLAWWSDHGRDLPWRRTRDPWAVLVSETMLQQTQVPRVIERWIRFLDRFPDPTSAAAAPVAALVEEWQGLGYNRRAVYLHRAAVRCVEDHGGALPDSLDDLLALPGIGPYTARAVLVFAHGADLGLVDTNAGRFVARALAGRAVRPAEAQRIADDAVPRAMGWDWGQAVFDLGALVCTKRAPGCEACPIAEHCAWQRAGGAAPDPAAGSAGVSRPQTRFDGSDRQGRGRLVDALRGGPVPAAELAHAMGWPADPERAARVAATVVRDGLARVDDGVFRLP